MKKIIRTILIANLIPLSYYPAHYASTVGLAGMQFWGLMVTIIMFTAGLFGTIASLIED